jgi:hypothetical protein
MRGAVAAVAGILAAAPTHPAEARGCHEVNPIVGYKHCGGFGQWAHPPRFLVELGVAWLRFPAAPIAATAVANPILGAGPYQLTSDGGGTTTAVGSSMRSLFHLSPAWYLGGDVRFASVTGTPGVMVASAGPSTMAAPGGFVGVTGLAIGSETAFGDVVLGVEVEPALRVRSLRVDLPGNQLKLLNDAAFVVEVHAHAALWLTTWLTVDATVGRALIGDGVSAGLSLGFHAVPFDGAR